MIHSMVGMKVYRVACPVVLLLATGCGGRTVAGGQSRQDTPAHQDAGPDGSPGEASTDAPVAEERKDGSRDVSTLWEASVEAASDVLDSGLQEMRCIENWPVPLEAGVEPPLSTPAPKILWEKALPWNLPPEGETVLAGERLALVGGNKLWILDRQGNPTGGLQDGQSMTGTAPVADRDGNFYFATATFWSVKPDGTKRWSVPLGPNLDPSAETTYTSTILLSPEGVLYFAASDSFLYALRASDGGLVWKKQVGLTSEGSVLYVSSGVGDTFFVQNVPRDVVTGEPGGQPRVNGVPESPGPGVYPGLLAGHFEEVGGNLLGRSYFLDKCGRLQWSLPNSNGSWGFHLSGFSDELRAGVYDGGYLAHIYSAAGKHLFGPAPMRGFPTTLGADNTVYNTECLAVDQSGTENMSILAYTWDLKELWSLDLGKPCTYSGTTLADDGVLYVTRRSVTGAIELIAIQTASPGVAHTAWPTRQHNNRRTGWLEP